MRNNLSLGKLGEDLAIKFLQKQKYKIIEKNFRSRFGEIDIIGRDKDTFVFIEVKTRISKQFGLPEEVITPFKLQSLKKTIDFYRVIHPDISEPLRIDLVGITLTPENLIEEIKLIKNIS